jgi:predicted AAA+ superfamily ATPase
MKIRKCFAELSAHLTQRQVTVITGMRRVGKSMAIQYLLDKVEHTNKILLDCERVEIRVLFNTPHYESIVEHLQLQGLNFSNPCVIALDEIQLVETLPSFIKYVYDTYGAKFIVSGSSSYYIKNRFSESLAGRKRIFEMYPLTFEEFLDFKESGIKNIATYAWKPYSKPWYERCHKLYEEYLRYGGFPEVVLQKNKKNKQELLRDIINSYIELDVKLLSDFSISEDLYKIAKLLAARAGNKIDYSKLGSIAGINRLKLKNYLDLFEHTYFVYLLIPYSKNIDQAISQQPKLFFSDNGILNELAGNQLSSGQLFENAIAAQLIPLVDNLNYYQRKTGQEIDFIIDERKGIEVKETAIEQDLFVLKQRTESIKLKEFTLISRYAHHQFKDFVWGGNIF